jgi:hypothetical protein
VAEETRNDFFSGSLSSSSGQDSARIDTEEMERIMDEKGLV